MAKPHNEHVTSAPELERKIVQLDCGKEPRRGLTSPPACVRAAASRAPLSCVAALCSAHRSMPALCSASRASRPYVHACDRDPIIAGDLLCAIRVCTTHGNGDHAALVRVPTAPVPSLPAIAALGARFPLAPTSPLASRVALSATQEPVCCNYLTRKACCCSTNRRRRRHSAVSSEPSPPLTAPSTAGSASRT